MKKKKGLTEAPPQRRAYKLDEAGFLLGGLSTATLRRRIRSGEIRAVSLSRHWLVTAEEIARVLKESEIKNYED